MADIKLLDCTLRDGGYVNNWQWGFGSARRIIQTLTRAGVDVVERARQWGGTVRSGRLRCTRRSRSRGAGRPAPGSRCG